MLKRRVYYDLIKPHWLSSEVAKEPTHCFSKLIKAKIKHIASFSYINHTPGYPVIDEGEISLYKVFVLITHEL